MSEPAFYLVADLDRPAPHPFAVLAVYPERREGTGCQAIVRSLHMTREEAELAACTPSGEA